MAILSVERIALQAVAADKQDAIRQAGRLLVDSGCVLPAYVDGMLLREQSMSTNMGNGVAIPHGVYENRDHILKTGLSFLQVPAGVQWDEDEKVFLVIGIAAASDEHVNVLSNLAEVIDDDAKLAELLGTTAPAVVVNHLDAPQAI